MNRVRHMPSAVPAAARFEAIQRTKVSIIWVVPLLAVVIGGYLLVQRFEIIGPVSYTHLLGALSLLRAFLFRR